MTLIVMLMLAVAAGVAQSLFPGMAWLSQARPPLLAGIVVFYAINFPTPVMVLAALVAGLLYDANGLMPSGVTTLYFCAAGALIRNQRALWVRGGGSVAAMLTAVTAGGHWVVVAAVAWLAWDRPVWLPGGWLRQALATVIMGAIAGVLMSAVGVWMHRRTGTFEELVNP